MYRSRHYRRDYEKQMKKNKSDTDCIFCHPKTANITENSQYFYVIENIFPYSIWDFYRLKKHLMLVPKRHVAGLSDLDEAEAKAGMKLLQKYEQAGFNIYARHPKSPVKTIVHQHTHLIKPTGKEQKFLLYLKKPHIHWHR